MTLPAFARTALLGLALTAGIAHAQRNDALYTELGGRPGRVGLMDHFMPRLLADARMNPFFKDVGQDKIKAQLEPTAGTSRADAPRDRQHALRGGRARCRAHR